MPRLPSGLAPLARRSVLRLLAGAGLGLGGASLGGGAGAVGTFDTPPPSTGGPTSVADQTVEVGARTRRGAGAFRPAGRFATVALTGRGTAAAEWQVLGGTRLAPARDGGLTDGGTVELVADGVALFTVTVAAVPGRFDIDSFAEPWPRIDSPELVAAWDAAGDGDTIRARDTGQEMPARLDCEITADRTAILRGEAVMFDLRFLNGPVNHLFRTAFVRWTFGTDDWVMDALPEGAQVRPGRSALHAYGPLAAHVFETGPAHEVTAEVRMLGGRTAAPRPLRIEIKDPDILFRGRRTVVWTVDGDARGAPPGALHVTAAATGGDLTGATFYDALAAAKAQRPRGRLLLRRGETTTIGDADHPVRRGGTEREIWTDGVYIDAFGSGDRPVIASAQTGPKGEPLFRLTARGGQETTVRNLRFLGRYDPADPGLLDTDATVRVFASVGNPKAAPRHATLAHLSVRGLGSLWISIHEARGTLCNIEVTDWYAQPFYAESSGKSQITGRLEIVHRLVGCHFHQNPRTAEPDPPGSGVGGANGGKVPNWTRAGPVRIQYSHSSLVAQCRLESRNGWGKAGGVEAHQPCIRLWTGGGSDEAISQAQRFVLIGNELVGGIEPIAIDIGVARARADIRWDMPSLQVSFNHVSATDRTRAIGGHAWAWGAWWNNVAHFAGDRPSVSDLAPGDGLLELRKATPPPGAEGFPKALTEAYSNTIIETRDRRGVDLRPIDGEGPHHVLLEANNLAWLPRVASPVTRWGEPLAAEGYALPPEAARIVASPARVAPVDRDGEVQPPGDARIGAVRRAATR